MWPLSEVEISVVAGVKGGVERLEVGRKTCLKDECTLSRTLKPCHDSFVVCSFTEHDEDLR
jgi:carbonic anhydrase/acetyltransferase-like protein (isoleucine patch superfamily)